MQDDTLFHQYNGVKDAQKRGYLRVLAKVSLPAHQAITLRFGLEDGIVHNEEEIGRIVGKRVKNTRSAYRMQIIYSERINNARCSGLVKFPSVSGQERRCRGLIYHLSMFAEGPLVFLGISGGLFAFLKLSLTKIKMML